MLVKKKKSKILRVSWKMKRRARKRIMMTQVMRVRMMS
jgi:hypothetical protein